MGAIRKTLKYVVVLVASAGAVVSWKANKYDFNSIGIVRFGRATTTVLSIAALYRNTIYATDLDPASEEYFTLRSKTHKMAAEKLLELCEANRGVYIKVGQHIGALDYLLPPEYVHTMKVLHSHAPASSISEVMQVLQEDLKQDPKDIFSSIEMEPVGTASLAQVHKATLKDGTPVAIKVQHPTVLGNSLVDMNTMEILVKFVSSVFPDFQFQWLVEETRKNLPLELNFVQEGQNAEKLQKIFSHLKWLKVPYVCWELTSPRVLTMEYAEGGEINDLEYIRSHKIDPFEVSNKLSSLYSEMIFVKGFVHSDPHPGNILVKKTGKELEIILLDHGLYANLSPEFRLSYSKLWLSILNADKRGMKEQSEKLGVGDLYPIFACMVSGRSWDAIQTGLGQTRYTKNEKDVFQKEIPQLLPQISNVLAKVNRQMLLILKTNDLLRGIEHSLKTAHRKTSLLVITRCCVHNVYNHRLQQCSSSLSRLQTKIALRWNLLKLSLYYSVLYFAPVFSYIVNIFK